MSTIVVKVSTKSFKVSTKSAKVSTKMSDCQSAQNFKHILSTKEWKCPQNSKSVYNLLKDAALNLSSKGEKAESVYEINKSVYYN